MNYKDYNNKEDGKKNSRRILSSDKGWQVFIYRQKKKSKHWVHLKNTCSSYTDIFCKFRVVILWDIRILENSHRHVWNIMVILLSGGFRSQGDDNGYLLWIAH